jgi:hypothetical protein
MVVSQFTQILIEVQALVLRAMDQVPKQDRISLPPE